jgi:hypothetical protein
MKQHKICCVCFSEIKTTKLHSIKTCNVCIDTHVCRNCFEIMRQTNIHRTCPVCRSENWCGHNDDVLIISDNFDDHTRNEQQVYLWKQCVNFLMKGIACIIIIWSVGFIMLSCMDNNFHQIGIFYVIFLSIFIGTISCCLMLYCRSVILNRFIN